MTAAAAPAAQPAIKAQRILALDIFRGMTIAFMIIVNTPGNDSVAWGPLHHAAWHGFTPTDLVFPSFLFAIGTSAWFSLKRFGHKPGGAALAKIWRRTAILFLIRPAPAASRSAGARAVPAAASPRPRKEPCRRRRVSHDPPRPLLTKKIDPVNRSRMKQPPAPKNLSIYP